MIPLQRLRIVLSSLLLAAVVSAGPGAGPALAVGTEDPTPPPPPKPADDKDTKGNTKDDKKAIEQQSQQRFLDGYKRAHALIYEARDYPAGIAALRALGHDDHADVANLIGFASRKLGRTDDAKVWYEKALAADPRHARTWSYYGMWHAEQGNRLKAQDHLEKVRLICGTDCKDYRELKGVMDGTSTY
jgi:tetratricopeptide (TPR) repeat protein